MAPDQDIFKTIFPTLRDQLVSFARTQGIPDDAVEWFRKNLDYNVPHGKLNRGLAVVDSVEILLGRPLTGDEYLKAGTLGWCVELVQAFFLVTDDIMDGSITRRSQPCWYRLPQVGTIAINDAFLLEASIFHLLRTYFKEQPYYMDIVDLFHEIIFQTALGQLVDVITAPEGCVNLANFSLEKHHLIVLYKTAYYSFYLPVALAMKMCLVPTSYTVVDTPSGPNTIHPYTIAREILVAIGEYFQIQDDYLDYSGTPEQIGKIGTDIVDNKCSWCINTALSLAVPSQRKILDENYGRKDPEKEALVKRVFEEVGLRKIYEEYEERVYKELDAKIISIPESRERGTLQREVFRNFLNKIYKRTK